MSCSCILALMPMSSSVTRWMPLTSNSTITRSPPCVPWQISVAGVFTGSSRRERVQGFDARQLRQLLLVDRRPDADRRGESLPGLFFDGLGDRDLNCGGCNSSEAMRRVRSIVACSRNCFFGLVDLGEDVFSQHGVLDAELARLLGPPLLGVQAAELLERVQRRVGRLALQRFLGHPDAVHEVADRDRRGREVHHDGRGPRLQALVEHLAGQRQAGRLPRGQQSGAVDRRVPPPRA